MNQSVYMGQCIFLTSCERDLKLTKSFLCLYLYLWVFSSDSFQFLYHFDDTKVINLLKVSFFSLYVCDLGVYTCLYHRGMHYSRDRHTFFQKLFSMSPDFSKLKKLKIITCLGHVTIFSSRSCFFIKLFSMCLGFSKLKKKKKKKVKSSHMTWSKHDACFEYKD